MKISSVYLKTLAAELAELLSLFDSFVLVGNNLNAWRAAVLTSIYKSGLSSVLLNIDRSR